MKCTMNRTSSSKTKCVEQKKRTAAESRAMWLVLEGVDESNDSVLSELENTSFFGEREKVSHRIMKNVKNPENIHPPFNIFIRHCHWSSSSIICRRSEEVAKIAYRVSR